MMTQHLKQDDVENGKIWTIVSDNRKVNIYV